MNEGKKTLAFVAAAGVMLGIAALVAWPTKQADSIPIAGNLLFDKFSDPQSAASMKIVTFDEEQGQLESFEVRRDRETGLWNIPSRDGYPADAIEQMRTAANSLVGLKILDVQTSNAEDHDDLGVVEPNLEDLEVGDQGVGRLVTFKNEAQETLASIIIGDQDKSDPEKRYVRIPGQDPVYVVKLDQASLTTEFGDWIESDLLKLSSIDIAELEIQDYTASIAGRQLSLTRGYTAKIKLDGSEWQLDQLSEYEPGNPLAEPQAVEVAADETLSKTKLDALKNALDDLKIVNVLRKPDGMSANLKADKDFLNDREALASLQANGFFPASASADGDVEIISANGELTVSLKDGVKYVMRFGNIASVDGQEKQESTEDESGDQDNNSGGVNRYLMVTAMVDQSKFPPPELQEVPQNIEELKVLLNPPQQESADPTNHSDPTEDTPEPESNEPTVTETEAGETEAGETEPGQTEAGETEAVETEAVETEPVEIEAGEIEAGEIEAAETEAEGSGEATGRGEAQEGDEVETADEPATSSDESTESPEEPAAIDADDQPVTETESADESKPDAVEESEPEAADKELTEEEMQERLEAEQEKITKENQRKLDARKDKIEAAEKKVRELNDRFADWYYVIAEDTYAKLRIKREELFEKKKDDAQSITPADTSGAGPQFQFPGAPGN